MKVLYVVSGNSHLHQLSPFIKEQVEAIQKKGIEFDYFFIEGKGIYGYTKNIRRFYRKIESAKPDIIHAHYGLSGLFANFQWNIPVVTTFHGSDINEKRIRPFSILANKFSKYSIFVSEEIAKRIYVKDNFSIIPCAVDFQVFFPTDKEKARELIGWNKKEYYILFASSFDISVKNYPLTRAAINLLDTEVNLIELQGYNRQEVNILLNASDVALLTSFNEGSPQFIKEAMACNRPIVTTDVGDVRAVIKDINGCFITSFQPSDVAEAIQKALKFNGPTDGRETVKHLDSEAIADRIIEVYLGVLKNK